MFQRTPALLAEDSGWLIARDSLLTKTTEYLTNLDPPTWSPKKKEALHTTDHSKALEWLDAVS